MWSHPSLAVGTAWLVTHIEDLEITPHRPTAYMNPKGILHSFWQDIDFTPVL